MRWKRTPPKRDPSEKTTNVPSAPLRRARHEAGGQDSGKNRTGHGHGDSPGGGLAGDCERVFMEIRGDAPERSLADHPPSLRSEARFFHPDEKCDDGESNSRNHPPGIHFEQLRKGHLAEIAFAENRPVQFALTLSGVEQKQHQ